MLLLLPRAPLAPRRVDEHVAPEAAAADELGAPTALVDRPHEVPDDLDLPAPGVARLGLPLVTVDLVRRADGVRRVVELGDGQVGDRPVSTPARDLVAAPAAGGVR